MKLQRQFVKRVKDKEYNKWVIILPPSIVKKARLKAGQELNVTIEKDKIIIRPKKSS